MNVLTAAGFVGLAAAGVLARWSATTLNRAGWPWGTLLVNLVATFALALVAGAGSTTLTLVGTALLGSLSTFSSVVAELAALARGRAVLYGLVTFAAGIGVAAAGLAVSLGS
jgi:CrcB protein